jgi:hypothetical protein
VISRTSKLARVVWSMAYLLLFLGGIVAFLAPSQVVAKPLVTVLVYLWAVFLTAGGALCLGGKIKNNWAGEIIGLPLLAAANYVFGALLMINGVTTAAIAIGGLFLGMGTACIGRWIELRKLAKDNLGVNSES